MIAEQVEGQLGAHPTGPQEGDSHGASLAPRGQFLHSRLWLRAGGGAQWSPCLRGSADVEHSRPPPRQAWAFPPRSPPPLPPSSREIGKEHTSELQSRGHLVCRLLIEKKKELHEGIRSPIRSE